MDENWAFDEIRDSSCKECGLHEKAQAVCLLGQGPRDAEVMIVGEAPGQREEDVARVFSGRAGQRLDLELKQVGLKREEIYITNAVKCRPPDNRTPTKRECKACRFYLDNEIDIVNPKYILLLGNPALLEVLGKSGISKHRGKIHEVDGRKILPTYHPAAINRNPRYAPYFAEDLIKFSQLIKGVGAPPSVEVTVVETLGQMRELVRAVKNVEVFAYDIETEGLYEWVPFSRLWCVAIATSATHAWVIPLEHPEHKWSVFAQGQIHKTLVFLFETLKKIRVAQNGEFDNRWLCSRGVDVRHDFDTMLAAYLLNENLSKGLEALAQRHLGVEPYKIDVTQKVPPLEELCIHCGKDACYTYALREVSKPQLAKDQGLLRIFKFLLMPASKIISKVEAAGIWVDKKRLTERTEIALGERELRVDQLNTMFPVGKHGKPINWSSTGFLRSLLYDTLKLPILEYTEPTEKFPHGQPSTAEPVIKQLKDRHPLINLLLEYRKWDKQLNTFLEPWALWSQWDGRLHPNYNLGGTVTGRPSCNDPNLQQTDRDEFIRGIVGAQPGYSLISADLKQAELRVAAMKSQDPNLMAVFREDKDPHEETAKRITGKSKITKAERKKAKPVNFGCLYGMGWRGFQKYALDKYDEIFSNEEAQAARQAFFDLYPMLLVWHERQRRLVRENHQVRSPLGRIRHLPDILSTDKKVRADAERQAINSPVQATASDINLLGAVLLDPEMDPDEIQLVGLVHDCLLFECKNGKIDKWVPRIKEVMENPPLEQKFGFRPSVPIGVDIKVSKYWEGED